MNRDDAITLLYRLRSAQNEFYVGGSGAALRRSLAADITWIISANNSSAGTYRGLDEVRPNCGQAWPTWPGWQ
jgi:hypothetical protein